MRRKRLLVVLIGLGATSVGCGLIAGVDWDRVTVGATTPDAAPPYDVYVPPYDANPVDTGKPQPDTGPPIDAGPCGAVQVQCITATGVGCCNPGENNVGTPAILAAGGNNTCAVTSAGKLRCWGSNSGSQLGSGATTATLASSNEPVPVAFVPNGATQITVGGEYACALVNSLFACWGKNDRAQFGGPTPASSAIPVAMGLDGGVPTALGAGAATNCVVIQDVGYCWGENGSYQVGTGGPAAPGGGSIATSPRDVQNLPAFATPLGPIRAGRVHSCASTNNALYCWGSNQLQRLGVSPTEVPSVSTVAVDVDDGGVAATQIGVGEAHACALSQQGLYCWGANDKGQLGVITDGGTPSPGAVRPTNMTTGVTSVCTGTNHTCAVKDGNVYCTGDGTDGQTGTTTPLSTFTLVPNVNSTALEVACGASHTCTRTSSNTVLCWGRNVDGQLGDGTFASSAVPKLVLWK